MMKPYIPRSLFLSSLSTLCLALLACLPPCFDRAAGAVPPPDGILGWWPGDGDAAALVGAPATLGGGAGFTGGEVGQAFQFNGSGQYAATALDVKPSVVPTTTWEAWVNPARINVSGRQEILSIDTGGYGRSVLIETGTTNFGVFTGSGVWQPVGASANEWQHIAVVFAPTNIWFYKNGVQFSYGQPPGASSSSATLNIGRSPGYGEYFTGAIDEVTVYDRALAPEEIQAIFAAGSAGKARSSSQVADLAVTQTVTPEPVSIGVGQRQTNNIVVSNLGPDTAPAVTLAVTLPANATFVSATSTAGSCYQSGGNVYCVPGDLTNGGAFTVKVILTPTAIATVTNTATVSSLGTDPSPANNSSVVVSHFYGHFTATDGDWSATEAVLEDTPEAGLMVRVGDIDNLGFGWPTGFDPFSGNSTPGHSFPWTVNTNDPPGTDRIMVVSSYTGSPPHGQDGYTSTTSRPGNNVQPITLNYSLGSQTVSSAALQIFVDDFQAPVWGASYQVTLNGQRAPFLESVINSLVQTGPIGKMITAALPAEFLPAVQSGQLVLRFDDPTTGAGDGYAIDFVKLLVNLKGFTQSGTIEGTVVDQASQSPLYGVQIKTQGLSATTTGADGKYTLTNVVAGLVSVTASLPDYAPQIKSTDLIAGQTNQLNFTLVVQPVLRIELVPANRVLVSWPGALTGFTLQTTSPLPTGGWTNEGSIPAIVNGRNSVTNVVGSLPRFYRLMK